MTASERLAAWRKREGISQSEAARRAGICQPTWSELEGGRAKRVSVPTAAAVERLTGGAVRIGDWIGDRESGEHPAATGTDR
jgi:transcriptional regulator with XRE-family HTH domain